MKIDVWDLQKASFLQRAQVRMKVTHREQERCCYNSETNEITCTPGSGHETQVSILGFLLL